MSTFAKENVNNILTPDCSVKPAQQLEAESGTTGLSVRRGGLYKKIRLIMKKLLRNLIHNDDFEYPKSFANGYLCVFEKGL